MCASFRGPFFWVVWKYSLLFCLGGAVEERYQILSTSKQTGRVVTQQSTSIRVFPKIVVPPKWMVKIRENPIRMDDLGGKQPLFLV